MGSRLHLVGGGLLALGRLLCDRRGPVVGRWRLGLGFGVMVGRSSEDLPYQAEACPITGRGCANQSEAAEWLV